MSIVTTHNQKSVEEFVGYIRERLQSSTRNWREIASAFAEAKEMFGVSSDSFKRLCKITKFRAARKITRFAEFVRV